MMVKCMIIALAVSIALGQTAQIGSESGWRSAETNKACNVMELQGTVGASVAINRKKGFADGISGHSNIKLPAVRGKR